jgi:hypothetical protein
MKKKLFLLILLFCIILPYTVNADEKYVLKGTVSKIDMVPKELFGSWQVVSELEETNYPKNFKKNTADFWNLRRSGNVIELRNPMTGAIAEVYLNDVSYRDVTFYHTQKDGNYKVTDTVSIKLNVDGTTFTGENTIILEQLIEEDTRYIIKSKKAVYKLYGKKVSGMNIF